MKYNFLFFVFLGMIIIFAMSPNNTIDIKLFEHSDKIKHVLAFFVLSFFFYKSLRNIKDIHKFYYLIIFACAIEIIQSFVGREASLFDFLASFLGIILYLLASKALRENKCCIKSN